MGDAPNRPTDSRPALPGHHRALDPALRELVRLLAEKAVEQYLDEAGAKTEQQSQGDDACPDLNEATSAQADQSVQEGQSYG